jgi:hypothetical protein
MHRWLTVWHNIALFDDWAQIWILGFYYSLPTFVWLYPGALPTNIKET